MSEIIVQMPLSILKQNEKKLKEAVKIIKTLIESLYVSEDGHFLDVGKDNYNKAVDFVEKFEEEMGEK